MFLSCRILISKGSRAIMKRYADSGLPCLTPLHTSNIWVEKPLFRMQLDILQYKTETHEMNDLPKLNEFNALKRKDQLSESKAFSKSNETIRLGICSIWVYSISGKTFTKRIARAILTSTFKREIGRQFLMYLLSLSFLPINLIIASLFFVN